MALTFEEVIEFVEMVSGDYFDYTHYEIYEMFAILNYDEEKELGAAMANCIEVETRLARQTGRLTSTTCQAEWTVLALLDARYNELLFNETLLDRLGRVFPRTLPSRINRLLSE